MPKSYLSEAEKAGMNQNTIYLAESDAADKAGDAETSWEWLAMAELPASTLMTMKRWYGADWIRERGFRTENAEREYGENWLD